MKTFEQFINEATGLPLPKDGMILKILGHKVVINNNPNDNYIGHTWKDINGDVQYEEMSKSKDWYDEDSKKDTILVLTKYIKGEVKYRDKMAKKKK